MKKNNRYEFLSPEILDQAVWEQVKFAIMLQIVMSKFAADAGLRAKLLATDDRVLIEGNTWGDRYWGAELVEAVWVGENMLGRVLMGVRERLR